jgi:hypothetical protein
MTQALISGALDLLFPDSQVVPPSTSETPVEKPAETPVETSAEKFVAKSTADQAERERDFIYLGFILVYFLTTQTLPDYTQIEHLVRVICRVFFRE